MHYLLILNDPPYGTERCYNGLRLGLSLRKQEGVDFKIFLLGDAVGCAKVGQKTPEGSYNLGRMLKGFTMLQVNINRLRRKLEHDPAHPRYILTKAGIGYLLAAQPEVQVVKEATSL